MKCTMLFFFCIVLNCTELYRVVSSFIILFFSDCFPGYSFCYSDVFSYYYHDYYYHFIFSLSYNDNYYLLLHNNFLLSLTDIDGRCKQPGTRQIPGKDYITLVDIMIT